MIALFHTVVARVRAFLRPGGLDLDFEEELEAHLAMAEEEKVRQGLSREEARRRARVELGGLTQLREAGRAARGLPWLDTFRLDVRLGLRMLRKSWGLTLVGGLAMTTAMVLGVLIFTFFDWSLGDALPLDEGDRVVALQIWDEKAQRPVEMSMDDFARWRDSLRSLEDIGAFQTLERNLILGDGSVARGAGANLERTHAETVSIAEMTASGFRLARVRPLLGRALAEEDELAGAAPVVVIGFDVWQSRFRGDPAALGQEIRLGDTVHTVVGVMPEDFAFPVSHRFWRPLRRNRSASLPADSEAAVFARLAPGFTLENARSELATLGLLPSSAASREAASLEARQALEPRVLAYAPSFTGNVDPWLVRLVLALVTLLLVPPCANIAILVYARTVTRQEEFAARYALGASRGRIVVQLFVEMLVLAVVAAGLALGIAYLFVEWLVANLVSFSGGEAPFWMDLTLSYRTVLFALVLAVVAALIAGLLPALKATGRQMRSGLHSLGSRTGIQLGKTWTALVVVQVAISLAALPAAVELGWGTVRKGVLGPGFAAGEYLTARLAMDREMGGENEPRAFAQRFAALQGELVRRLNDEPGVWGVTLAEIPGDEPWDRIEIEVEIERVSPPGDVPLLPTRSLVRRSQVDESFFEVFEIPTLTGRAFEMGEGESEDHIVIVNQTFVQQLVGAGNPLGHRISYLPMNGGEESKALEARTWYEIVGGVADRPANATHGTVYHPGNPGQVHPASLALRVGSDPTRVADRLREITTGLSPSLRVDEIFSLDEIYREKAVGNNIGAFILAAVTLSVLLLAAAGMYALLSFTVNQRRREIGIRAALGAQPRRLLGAIFRRVLGQVAVGTTGGVLVALLLKLYLPAEKVGGWSVPGIIPAATVLMLLVGLLAAAGPARRGLRVDPIEELRNG